MRQTRGWSWVSFSRVAAIALSVALAVPLAAPGAAAAQVPLSVVTGDGACPAGHQPLSLADAQRERARICGMLGQWFIARLAGGGSIDGNGYGCQLRASDPRPLGHTLCTSVVIGIPTPPAIDPAVIPGTYDAVHPRWRDAVTFSADGTYRRASGHSGRWRLEGITLVLDWARRGTDRLDRQADGSFRAASGLTLVRRGDVVGRPVPPPMFDPASVPGTYDGVHPHWRDAVIISSGGTYARGSGDPGRWRIEGNTLVLEWANWGPERLERVRDGVFRASNGFTLTRRSGPVVVTPPPPPVIDRASVPGLYDGVHPHWRDTVTIAPDGTYARGNGDPGRWWIEGTTLVLDWTNWGTARLQRVGEGVYRGSDGFTITRRASGPIVVVPTPQPPVIDVSRVPGTYDAIHHRWRDTIVLSRDGSYVRASGEAGRWRIDGNMLLLEWSGRGTSRLVWVNEGVFRSVGGRFTITRRPEPDRRVRRGRGRR